VPAPILANKHHSAPSAFTPENLLREARRQKGLAATPVPEVCVLDPDGDMVRRLRDAGRAHQDPAWARYHTDLYRFTGGGLDLGLVGCAIGAPFAVLVAEQLFASGCRLLISITSAGRLAELRPPPCFILIERAQRDEGTSYHYLPPAEFSEADPGLVETVAGALVHLGVERGTTWTTDAPFRETRDTGRLRGFPSAPECPHDHEACRSGCRACRLTAHARTVGLVAHSVASMIAVETVPRLGVPFGGLFSIEGNLTAEDAYLSGRAADFDDADKFKQHFVDHIWTMAQTHPVMRAISLWPWWPIRRRCGSWDAMPDTGARAMTQGKPTGAFNARSTIGRAPARPRRQRVGSLNPTSNAGNSPIQSLAHGRSTRGDSGGHRGVFRSDVNLAATWVSSAAGVPDPNSSRSPSSGGEMEDIESLMRTAGIVVVLLMAVLRDAGRGLVGGQEPGASEFQQLRQRLSHRGRAQGAKRSSEGAFARSDDRARSRLRFHRSLQPGVQGRDGHDPDGVQKDPPRRRR
jgi:uridine phosphorylase